MIVGDQKSIPMSCLSCSVLFPICQSRTFDEEHLLHLASPIMMQRSIERTYDMKSDIWGLFASLSYDKKILDSSSTQILPILEID